MSRNLELSEWLSISYAIGDLSLLFLSWQWRDVQDLPYVQHERSTLISCMSEKNDGQHLFSWSIFWRKRTKKKSIIIKLLLKSSSKVNDKENILAVGKYWSLNIQDTLVHYPYNDLMWGSQQVDEGQDHVVCRTLPTQVKYGRETFVSLNTEAIKGETHQVVICIRKDEDRNFFHENDEWEVEGNAGAEIRLNSRSLRKRNIHYRVHRGSTYCVSSSNCNTNDTISHHIQIQIIDSNWLEKIIIHDLFFA